MLCIIICYSLLTLLVKKIHTDSCVVFLFLICTQLRINEIPEVVLGAVWRYDRHFCDHVISVGGGIDIGQVRDIGIPGQMCDLGVSLTLAQFHDRLSSLNNGCLDPNVLD